MCYFSSIKANIRDIEKVFHIKFINAELFKPAYSVSAFVFPKMPVISSSSIDSISLYAWGLIPFWVKTQEQANSIRLKTLNARSETIFEKPAFRHSISNKRCLVIVDGFYEWRHIDKKRYPYYISLKSRGIFSFGGIWETWVNPETKDSINTFSVITTEANELMSEVHNSRKRMPLLLPKELEKTWLDTTLDLDAIKEIMKPYNSNDMEAHPVENKISRLGYNTKDASVTEFYDYPEMPSLH